MAIEITCPHCHARHRLKDSPPAGRKIKCKECGGMFSGLAGLETVPGSPPAAASPEASGSGPIPLAPSDDEQDLVGQVLGGCRIEAKLGEGGMGRVYRAHHLALDIPVAVKVLSPRVTAGSGSTFGDRFLREARAAAKLQHQNIVGVLNVGEENGRQFIVMQYIEGESLQDRIARDGRLDPDRAVEIMVQLAQALAVAHRNRIIHRDIKPENVLIDLEGTVKLADLGLAKNLAERTNLTLSNLNMGMGTPHYMPPEQADDPRRADARSDIYALGCTFYKMLTGRVPFDAESAVAVIKKHSTDPVPDPRAVSPEIPADLAAIVQKMMAKDPAHRQQTAEEVLADLARLRAVARGLGPSRFAGWGQSFGRRRRWCTAGAVLVAAVGLAAVLAIRHGKPPSPAVGEAGGRSGPTGPREPRPRLRLVPSRESPAGPAAAAGLRLDDWLVSAGGPGERRGEYAFGDLESSLADGVLSVRNTTGRPRATLRYTAARLDGDFTIHVELRNVSACGLIQPPERASALRVLLAPENVGQDSLDAWRTVELRRTGERIECRVDGRTLPASAFEGTHTARGFFWLSVSAEAASQVRNLRITLGGAEAGASDESARPEAPRPSPPAEPPARPTDTLPTEIVLPVDEVFRRWDRNNDDVLTADEIPERLRERMMQADANRDGKVTRQELEAAREGVRQRAGPLQGPPRPPGRGPPPPR